MKIRLGTRKSPLAMWQANKVKDEIEAVSEMEVEIIPIISDGDENLKQPIYSMGITGVFTKSLDIALVNNNIDIAVHSLKDVPTELAKNLELIAVLERDYNQDVLVKKNEFAHIGNKGENTSIATGSLRRRAFLRNKFPFIRFIDIRGNVQTRLAKIKEQECVGTVLSLAGIKRMELDIPYQSLDFMLPAVGQGVIAIVSSRDLSNEVRDVMDSINNPSTYRLTSIERSFLNVLEGGCTAPIGVRTTLKKESILFEGAILSIDGKEKIEIKEEIPPDISARDAGEKIAKHILQNGGEVLIHKIKKEIKNC